MGVLRDIVNFCLLILIGNGVWSCHGYMFYLNHINAKYILGQYQKLMPLVSIATHL